MKELKEKLIQYYEVDLNNCEMSHVSQHCETSMSQDSLNLEQALGIV